MKMIKKLFQNYITSKYITVLVTLINANCLLMFLANKYQGYIQAQGTTFSEFELFMYAVVVELIGIIIIGAVIYRTNKQKYEDLKQNVEYSEGIIDLVKRLILLQSNIISKYKIYNFTFVTNIEKSSKKGDEIWIITGDLEEDSSNDDLISIIGSNLNKGVKYRFFITKDPDGKISGKASNGKKALTNKYKAYVNKRLYFNEIDYELVAPDIDIIIYNATDSKEKRRGFVCVEIGDKTDTYAYQELDSNILEEIINQINPNIEIKRPRKEKKDSDSDNKVGGIIGIIYDIFSGFLLAVLSYSKIVSIKTAITSIVPAVIVWLCLIIAQESIDAIFSGFGDIFEVLNKDRKNAYDVLTKDSLKAEVIKAIENEEERVFQQFSLEKAEKIEIKEDTKRIWLLTDLSYDIASNEFSNFITQKMNEFKNLECVFLYIDTLAASGRSEDIDSLSSAFGDRIMSKMISSENNRYIWSKTYGMVFIQNTKPIDSKVYISLGTAETALFKKVETEERETATMLGILKKFLKEGGGSNGSK